MSEPKNDPHREPPEDRAVDKAGAAPVGDGDQARLDQNQDGDQEADCESAETDAEGHARYVAMKQRPLEAIAVIGMELGKAICRYRETRAPAARLHCEELIDLLVRTPARTHTDLLALTALARAVLTAPREDMTDEEAIGHSLLFLERAIEALELDTGVGAEAFTGADRPTVN